MPEGKLADSGQGTIWQMRSLSDIKIGRRRLLTFFLFLCSGAAHTLSLLSLVKQFINFLRPHSLPFPEVSEYGNIHKQKNGGIGCQLPDRQGIPIKNTAKDKSGQIKEEGFRKAVMAPFPEFDSADSGIDQLAEDQPEKKIQHRSGISVQAAAV